MADSIAEVRAFFREKGIPLGQDDVWEVQKVAVVKHKALERLAAKLAIRWQKPDILRCEADEAAILVIGSLGEHVEWSIGEARIVPMRDTGEKNKWGKPIYEPTPGCIGNYQITPKQASYMWAMAEKRGKDRVILKLAGIDAYSEEESDDFTARRQNAPAEPQEPAFDEHPLDAVYMVDAERKIASFTSVTDLLIWWGDRKAERASILSPDQRAMLMKEVEKRRDALAPKAAA